jgi:hypothetical protein
MNRIFSFDDFLSESNLNKVNESTEFINSSNGNIILISDYAKDHIKDHNKPSIGSIFRKGITDREIIDMVDSVKNEVNPNQSAYEIDVPGIGYNLVLPYAEAARLEDSMESTTQKKEGPNTIVVPMFKTSQPISDFSTDILTLIIRASNPQFLPEDVLKDPELLEIVTKKIEEGKCYSLLTAFPGDPNIPKASDWKGEYAVVIPSMY